MKHKTMIKLNFEQILKLKTLKLVLINIAHNIMN